MSGGKPLGLAALGALVAACAGLAGLQEAAPEQRFAISTLELKLADAPCGSEAESTIDLDNGTDQPTDYELTIPTGSAYVLRRPDGIENLVVRGHLEPHTQAKVPIVLTTARPGIFGTDVFVNAMGKTQIVRVEAKVTGTDLAFTPPLVDFGEVRQGAPVPDQNVELQNSGNEAVTIKSFASEAGGTDFTMLGADLVIGPGEKKPVPARFASGPAGRPMSASFTPVTEKPTCGPAPKLTLKGVRVNQDVLVSPLTAGFGEVNCNSASLPGDVRVVRVTNYGASPVSFTVSVAGPTFNANPSSGTVPGASGGTPGTRDIAIGRNPVGFVVGDVNEAVTVAIGGAVPTSPVVQASLRVVGALLEISPAVVPNVTAAGTAFQVRNYGNRPVTVLHGVTSSTTFAVTGSSALNPGEIKNPVVFLTATATGDYATDITTVHQANGPLCVGAPVIRATAKIN